MPGNERAEIVLKDKILHVILNGGEIWESGEGYLVSDFITGDVDHDGEDELITLFWKQGSFKEHSPFFMKRNDSEWTQHIGIYNWKEEYPYRLDPAWVSSKLGISVSSVTIDTDGVVAVSDVHGSETRWYWRSWGLALLEDGERPFHIKTSEREPEQTVEKKSITFTASGDNLIHEAIYRAAKEKAGGSGYDFSFAYEDVAGFFEGHDINFINMESLVADSIEPSDYPCFVTPTECAGELIDIGFNCFNLSNNHIYDKGNLGLNATEAFWGSVSDKGFAFGLYREGSFDDIPVFEYDGVRIAFLGYTYGTNLELPDGAESRVICLDEKEIIKEQLGIAREKADIVILSCHFGTENSHIITDAERTLGRTLTDWGADLVIGTHPHVIKDAQWFNTADGRRALVCYSLGNFLSSMKKCGQLVGLTLECRFEGEEGGKYSIRDARLIPNVTVYDPYYKDPHVKWLSDYSREEAQDSRDAYRDIDYSYDRISEILKENVSRKFLK
ncbi:MAG: CapA family protein [Lachnospiraceae bacterium]|nr:CapA family protein [Lachnospiraceae bacterium]